MNEELKNKLNSMSLDLIDQIQKGAEWTSQQTALFVKEFVTVYIIENSIHFFCLLLLSSICLFASRGFHKMSENKELYEHQKDGALFATWAALFISLIVFCVNISTNGVNIAKGIWAPRVVVVEQLRSMTR